MFETRGMSVEVATPGPFNNEENTNVRLSCVLIVLRYHCAGASIGASQGEYSVKLLGTGLLPVSRNGQAASHAHIAA